MRQGMAARAKKMLSLRTYHRHEHRWYGMLWHGHFWIVTLLFSHRELEIRGESSQLADHIIICQDFCA
jgi:hypothetical protein